MTDGTQGVQGADDSRGALEAALQHGLVRTNFTPRSIEPETVLAYDVRADGTSVPFFRTFYFNEAGVADVVDTTSAGTPMMIEGAVSVKPA